MTKPSLHQFNMKEEDREYVDEILHLENPTNTERANAIVDMVKKNSGGNETIEGLKIEKLKQEIELVKAKRERIASLKPLEELKLVSDAQFTEVKKVALESITPHKILETQANTRLIESKTRVTDAMLTQCEKHGVMPTHANIKAIASDVKENFYAREDAHTGVENKPCFDELKNELTCTQCGIIIDCGTTEKTFVESKIKLLSHWNQKHIAATDYLHRYLYDLKFKLSGLDGLLDVEEETPAPYPFCLKGCGARTDTANGVCRKCMGLVN